tara:strand:- start:5514 stop:5672 length:159 start_codon:yes stop_codon:yes gene_type:complete
MMAMVNGVEATNMLNLINLIFKETITHIEQGLNISCLISVKEQVLVSDTGLD